MCIGRIVIDAAFYLGYPRGDDEWTDGIQLEYPASGQMLYREGEYPDDWLAAGIRDIAVLGIPYHTDAQRPEFGIGRYVRLVPEPTNRKGRRAIAVRSADGRLLAGYVPRDRLDDIWATKPAPQMGLVVWDHYTGPVRERLGLYVLAASTIELRLVPPQYAAAEQARRDARHRAVEEGRIREQEERKAARQAHAAELAGARAAEHARVRDIKNEAKAARASLEAARRVAGLCLDCGAPIEPSAHRGRPPVRCQQCRGQA